MQRDQKVYLEELQNNMRSSISTNNQLNDIKIVAGADLTVEGDIMVGCLVVLSIINNNIQQIYEKCTIVEVDIPYIPGLLCFREGPVVIQLFKEFENLHSDIKIDLLLVDGSGEWHPRGFGLACYVGLELGIPTCGISKTFLYVGSNHYDKNFQIEIQNELLNKFDFKIITHKIENDSILIQLAIMRTTDSNPFKPIFISAGHLCNLNSLINFLPKICLFREPEPLRLADRISRQFVKNLKK